MAYALIYTCLTGSDICDDPTIRLTATSTAPQIQIGRKRRFSTTEPDEESVSSTPKKHRAQSEEAEGLTATPQVMLQSPTQEEGVKEVTQRVEEVELSDGKEAADTTSDAAAIPLPESPGLEPRTVVAEATGLQDQEVVPSNSPVAATTEPTEDDTDMVKEEGRDPAPSTANSAGEGRGEREAEESVVVPAPDPPEDKEASTSPSVDIPVPLEDAPELRNEAVESTGQGEDS